MLKIIGDTIDVNLDHMGMKTIIPGKLDTIDHTCVIIQTAPDTFLTFDPNTGEIIDKNDASNRSWISLDDLDIPESPYNPVKYRMEENFHYCFTKYSNWEEIDDTEFQRLKNLYIETAKRLESYVVENAD